MSDDLIGPGFTPPYDFLQHEIERLKAIVDAIPDKDDPLGWVQEVQAKRMGVPTPSEALQMQVTINRELQAEIDDLRALRDAIPGDDILAVVEWMVAYCRLMFSPLVPFCIQEQERRNEQLSVQRAACPPSVRAALTQSKGD